MCLNIFVLNTDQRQKYLIEYLNGIKSKKTIRELGDSYNIIVLPTPLHKYDIDIFENHWAKRIESIFMENSNEEVEQIINREINPEINRKIDCEENCEDNCKDNCKRLNPDLIKQCIIVAGSISEKWRAYFREIGVEWIDFMEDESTSIKNSQITAEATVMTYIANSRFSIEGEKIIISGYGKCGRALAKKFMALGAKVTVLARSKDARRRAKEAGYNAVPFAYGPQEAYDSVAIINTVPGIVIEEAMLSELHEDSLLIEIASAPGGYDMDAVKKYGLRYIDAPGLPSRYIQRAGGKAFATCINSYIKTRFNNGVEDVWIYQVLP